MRQLLRFLTGLVVLWALGGSPLVTAQAIPSIRIDRLDATAFPAVQLFVSVADGQGKAVPNLGPEAFVLTENGQNVPLREVTMVAPDQVSLRVVLALDISKSIKNDLAQMKQAAVQFIQAMTPNDELALVFFGDKSQIVEGFTLDHGKIINQINALQAENLQDYTALYNGAVESIKLAAARQGGRQAVVLVTDGKNTQASGVTSLTLSDARHESDTKQIPLYVIGVGNAVLDQELRLLATNGRYYSVAQPAELSAAYTSVGTALRQQYALHFTSALPSDNQSYVLNLSVNVPEVGAATTSMSLVTPAPTPTPSAPPTSLPIPRPSPQLTLPDPIVINRPNTIAASVSQCTAPCTVSLLLDSETVVTETLISATWNYTWTPAGTVVSGTHTLELQAVDAAGVKSRPAPRPVLFVTAPFQFPLWGWVAVVVLMLFLVGLVVLLMVLQRRNAANMGGPNTAYNQATPLPMLGSNLGPPTVLPPPPLQPAPAGPTGVYMPNRGGGGGGPMAATELAQPQAQPGALLVVQQGQANPMQLHLTPTKEVLIGRHQTSDMILDDRLVSAEHARVRFLENGFTIVDLGSTNGLRVNGKPVTKLRLQHNDRIEIGTTTLIFQQLR